MPQDRNSPPASTNQVLVKLRPTAALAAAGSRANLRPLQDTRTAHSPFGVAGEAQWFVAELRDGAATPWDLAHGRLADQLGVSPSDVVFAEPDIVHNIFVDPNEEAAGRPFAVGESCEPVGQDDKKGKPAGPGYAWHLGDDFSQLGRARSAVAFTEPRTRIAHLDTGYYAAHVTLPRNLRRDLQRNFVARDDNSGSAEDPDNKLFLLDNSGHGTGTLGIVAGGMVPAHPGVIIGGAPDADVVPLRVADSVVLLRTSAFAEALHYVVDHLCDVVTMSMGGLPSRAWKEAVNRAYLAGVCIVAAAGNNANGIPTRNIVYPARYGRVIAACGVMADKRPYAGLTGLKTIEGNYGPRSVMGSALASYTPNIPWARFGCKDLVRLNGEGTSAATPQIAAAAALWLEKYKAELPRDWRRVEAVRKALFSSAENVDFDKLGHGILKAAAALDVRPVLGLPQTPEDKDSFAFLRVLTGLGISEAPPREQMFNLELAQRWLLNEKLQELVPDPDDTPRLDEATLKRVMEAIVEDKDASLALRKHVAARYPVAAGQPAPRTELSKDVVPEVLPVCDEMPALRNPAHRRLRVYGIDPSFSSRLDTAAVNEVTLHVRWEPLDPGPSGEYLKIEDEDAAGKTYPPINLQDPLLLARDGWAPSEGNPQFHQQMVYAVAMKTIEHFERALGRPVLWRHRINPKKPDDESQFVRQLVVKPHALRQANAFYSPQEVALKFGYFEAEADDPGDHIPGSRVYSCLSHDIIAHETTHAILDGMYRRFNEPTNPDVLALHEGFADIVALMQHFTIPEVLQAEIARIRGDLESESMLGSLAVQFGRATGSRGALRDAIGKYEDGVWKRFKPDPTDLQKRLTPHARGAVLVAAVFDAFIAIYTSRTADLLRIYTGGTGVLPAGAIHPDLVLRLADEAAKSAGHVLNMCIRALDYLPPVDVTFFEYLRAVITADYDIMRDDRYNYRLAFVEAFRRRGIYPINLDNPTPNTNRTLAVDTLRWQGLDFASFDSSKRAAIQEQSREVIESFKEYANGCFYLSDREKLFTATREQRHRLHAQLRRAFQAVPAFAVGVGIDAAADFEVHELRRAMHVDASGRYVPLVIVALTQSKEVAEDAQSGTPGYTFRGGSTLVVDLSVPEVKYAIYKRFTSAERQKRTAAFLREAASDPLRSLFLSAHGNEPFAALHALSGEGH